MSYVWAYSAGRLIAGIASDTATGTLGKCVNKLTPAHARSFSWMDLQISVTSNIYCGLSASSLPARALAGATWLVS